MNVLESYITLLFMSLDLWVIPSQADIPYGKTYISYVLLEWQSVYHSFQPLAHCGNS